MNIFRLCAAAAITGAILLGGCSLVSGNAMRLRYVLALPVGDKVYNVDFDDWMYPIDDRVMLNRAQMSKFNFGLGGLTVVFNRRAGQVAR